MNSERRADLQRKLSMGAVPRPPADLLEQIKADIPVHLVAQPEPPRRLISMALYMRVAAMLILLFTSGLLTWRLLQDEPSSRPFARDRRAFPVLQRTAEAPVADVAAPVEQVHLEITEALPAPEALVAATSRPIVQAGPSATRAADRRQERAATAAASRDDGSAAAPAETLAQIDLAQIAAVQDVSTETFASNAAAPADAGRDAAPRVAAAPAPPPATERFSRATSRVADPESITVTASAPTVLAPSADTSVQARTRHTALASGTEARTEAAGKAAAPQSPTHFFGVSVDPEAFALARSAAARGQVAQTERIDVEAIVNYFAGPATKPPRSGVRLDVELSPAPLSVPGDRAYLRLSVDTPRTEGRSVPIAQNVDVHVELNDDVVSSWRRIGGDASILAEPLLHSNVAVTLLYELDLRAPIQASSKIARVELKYRNVADRKHESSEMTLRARDLVTQWSSASRRHRLATLGALWGEGLVDRRSAPEIAKKAQELAEQSPRDARARELANAASATAGGSRF